MEVRICGWHCKGLRGGLRDLSIDLGAPPARWTLIQMPNGTGKTTTMSLLSAVLTGSDLTAEAIASLRPGREVTHGFFELRLLVGQDPYSLAVDFDFEAGSAAYSTTRVKSHGGGKEPGIRLPDPLRILLTPEFVRLVVFDGEMARQIRDLKSDEATLAIRRLYRLELLDFLADVARRQANDAKVKAIASRAETQKGVRRRQTMFNEAESALLKLVSRKRDIDRRLQELTGEIARLDGLITTRVSTNTSRANLLEEKRALEQEAAEEIRADAQRLLEILRSPAAIHSRVLERLQQLGGKLERLKLPKTMSREFFYELAEQDMCVCGRPIGDTEHDAIILRAPQYLAENQIAVINAMKSAVRAATADPEGVKVLSEAINAADRKRRLAAEAVRSLVDAAEAEGDAEIASAKAELSRLSNEMHNLQDELDALTGLPPSGTEPWKRNIRAAQLEFAERKRALEEATETRRLALQTDWFTGVLSRVRELAEQQLTEQIRQRTNEKLERLVPSEELRVTRIAGALILASDDGTARAGVSEGQSLAVAYAFLTSLFESAVYRLPFVVDSPAISLDVQVRREVAALVPDLFHQMIMFVISSERRGFAEEFYGRDNTRFITVWRDPSGDVCQSDDLGFFESFHTDVEPEADS